MTAPLPTGALALDVALGTGGYPRGATVELYGVDTVGKTTLALTACREAQLLGETAVYLDADGTLDRSYAAALGVDVERLLVVPPQPTGEADVAIAARLLASRAVGLLVIDAVAALLPEAEATAPIGAAPPGAHRRLVERGIRALDATAQRTGATLLCVSRIVAVKATRGPAPWVEGVAGGPLLPQLAAVRVRLDKVTSSPKWTRTRATVAKHQDGARGGTADVVIGWGTGIDDAVDLLVAGYAVGVLQHGAGGFTFEGATLGERDEALLELDGAMGARVRAAVLAAAPWAAGVDVGEQEARTG